MALSGSEREIEGDDYAVAQIQNEKIKKKEREENLPGAPVYIYKIYKIYLD